MTPPDPDLLARLEATLRAVPLAPEKPDADEFLRYLVRCVPDYPAMARAIVAEVERERAELLRAGDQLFAACKTAQLAVHQLLCRYAPRRDHPAWDIAMAAITRWYGLTEKIPGSAAATLRARGAGHD